jgi:hypothetical protein
MFTKVLKKMQAHLLLKPQEFKFSKNKKAEHKICSAFIKYK